MNKQRKLGVAHTSGGFVRLLMSVTLVLTGLFLAVFGNLWAPPVFELLSGSEIGAWLELIAPFLPIVLIGSGAALYTSRHSRSRIR
jgi:hypothetical protein